jgi:hypothetical protein
MRSGGQVRVGRAGFDGVDVAHVGVGDQRQPDQVADGQRRGAAGQFGVGLDGQHVGVVEQFGGCERAVRQGEDDEGQVQLSAF